METEKTIKNKNVIKKVITEGSLSNTKKLTLIAVLGAMAAVLMYFEFPLTFVAPDFYKLDLSEIPVMIGTFMMGPIAGVLIEAVKILIKLVIKPTSTAYVGEFANFCVGCAMLIPAGIIYKLKKTKKSAVIAMIVGSVVMAIAGVFLNYYLMLPFYVKAYNFPLEAIIGAGAKINSLITSKWTFVWFAVAPFNLIKGIMVSVITLAVYKRISTFVRNIGK